MEEEHTKYIRIIMMYVGYYICEGVMAFRLLPFWTVSIIGLRRKLVPLILFSIVTGIALHFIVLKQVLGHVIMNVGRIPY